MPTITWSNGKIDTAPTWQALLDHVRETQWSDMDEPTFRDVLAMRALRWTKTQIDPTLPPALLFGALEDARLIEIIDTVELVD